MQTHQLVPNSLLGTGAQFSIYPHVRHFPELWLICTEKKKKKKKEKKRKKKKKKEKKKKKKPLI